MASYHLARFLQETPPGARICLLGQSDGGRIALTTMHFLSGAVLPAIYGEPRGPVERRSTRPSIPLCDRERGGGPQLAQSRRSARSGPSIVRSVASTFATAATYALALFIFGRFTGFRPAIGRVGLTSHDMRALGPLSARVEQINLRPRVGISHTSFSQALGFPDVADRIARYTSWSDVASPIRY